MEDKRNILSILSSAIGDYLSLRADDFKKNIVFGLSVGFSRVLVTLVITMLMLIVLGVLAYAFIMLIGEAIGSLSGAAFIVGAVSLAGAAVIFLLRKKLFLNIFSDIFTEIINAAKPSNDLRTLLQTIVNRLRNHFLS